MKESDLRAWHRNLGIILSLFIILQTGTGLLISLSEVGIPHTHANSKSVVKTDTHEKEKSKSSASIVRGQFEKSLPEAAPATASRPEATGQGTPDQRAIETIKESPSPMSSVR